MSSSSSSSSSSGLMPRGTSITINPKELKELAVVHIPCLVQNEETVIEMLGGTETIKSAIKNKTDLIQLKFPNTDPLRHHLVGTRQKCNSFVVKLSRNLSTNTSNTSTNNNNTTGNDSQQNPYKVEVIGKTCHTYNFNTLSDYQFLAQSTDKVVTYTNYESIGRALEVIARPMAKPLLGTVSMPIFHDRKKFKKAPLESFKAVPERKIGEPVPDVPIFDEDITPVRTRLRNIQKKKDGAAAIRKLFDAIPLRLRKHLLEHPQLLAQQNLLIELLSRFVYCYNMGPFKGLLVRHGFDPENNSDCRYLQILQLRLPADTYRDMYQTVWEHLGRLSTYKTVNLDTLEISDVSTTKSDSVSTIIPKTSSDYLTCTFGGVVIRRQFSIQICSLMDEDLLVFVKNLPFNETFSGTTGYFTVATLGVLRERVMQHLINRVRELISRPVESLTHVSTQSQSGGVRRGASAIPRSISSGSGRAEHGDEGDDEGDDGNEEEGELYAYRWFHRYISGDDSGNGNRTNSDNASARQVSEATRKDMEKYVANKARLKGINRKRKRAGMKVLQRLNADGYSSDEDNSVEPRRRGRPSSGDKQKLTRKTTAKKSNTTAAVGSSHSSSSSAERSSTANQEGSEHAEGEDGDDDEEDNNTRGDVVEYENVQGFDIFDDEGDEEDNDDDDEEEEDYESEVYDD